jgi:outer membrane autotransporter protein
VSGAIATSGDTSNGVNITDTEGSVKVTASGVVTTYGEYAKGLRVANTTGNASLDVSGVVGTYGAASPAIYVLNTSGEVDIVSTGSVAANGDGSHGISVKGTTVGSVDIDVGGEVSGGSGSGSGIYLNNPGAASSRIDILSGGSLGALSDLAARSVDGALTINNAGAVTGYLVLGGGDDVFNNQSGGVWELRNYIDTDADGERDLEGAAQADFGGGADSFVNDGILRLASVSPAGSQGSLENLEIFTNRGHIDLADGQTGDELAISGEFQSDGGSLAVDVVLDEGTAGADVLVLGAVTMPNLEPTLVYVDNVGGQAGKTAGNGILVVDTSSSVDGAFALGERVISGAYEYLLAEANEDWYLQSSIFEGAAEYPALLSGAFASFHADLAPLHQRLRNVSSADSIPSVEPAGWAGPYDRIGPWLEVVAVKQSVDSSASYGQAIAKLIVGLDGELQGSTEGRISLGGFAGFGQTSLEFDESGAESSSDVLLAGLHGSYTLADFYTQAIAKFEHHRGEIEGIAFADGGAPVGVDVAGGSLEAGYLFDTPHLTLSPHARLTYAYAWAEDFDDASGAAIDLKDARSLRGELALRLGKELWQGTSLGSASLELGTRHEFLGEQQAEVSGLTFTDALPGTTAFIAPNLNVELLESSLFLGLRGEYAKGGGSDELSGSLSLNLNL